jgi:hypothetical protein
VRNDIKILIPRHDEGSIFGELRRRRWLVPIPVIFVASQGDPPDDGSLLVERDPRFMGIFVFVVLLLGEVGF